MLTQALYYCLFWHFRIKENIWRKYSEKGTDMWKSEKQPFSCGKLHTLVINYTDSKSKSNSAIKTWFSKCTTIQRNGLKILSMCAVHKFFSSAVLPPRSCFLLTWGSLGAASRLPSGLKSHLSCSRFSGERRNFQVRPWELPGRDRGKRLHLQSGDQPRESGGSAGPRTSGRSGHRAPLFAPGLLGPGPSDTGGPALHQGGARRGRPCREAGGRRPPPTGAAPDPSRRPAARYCFWRAHKPPLRPSRIQVSSRGPIRFLWGPI